MLRVMPRFSMLCRILVLQSYQSMAAVQELGRTILPSAVY